MLHNFQSQGAAATPKPSKQEEKKEEPKEEKKDDEDEGIDPVMKQYMAMVQAQRDKEKQVSGALFCYSYITLFYWFYGSQEEL